MVAALNRSLGCLVCLCFLCFPPDTTAGSDFVSNSTTDRSNEYKIKQRILKDYDKSSRPVRHDETTTEVTVAIALYHILGTNEKEQTFTCILGIRQRWTDEYLRWDKIKFGNVSSIRIPSYQIWTPDVIITNYAGQKYGDFYKTNAIVKHNGLVLWLTPAQVRVKCNLDPTYFPFDSQKCNIKFLSWTYDDNALSIQHNESFKNMIYYEPHVYEWEVENITAKRTVRKYVCCPEPYGDVTFTIHMKRGYLFHVFNLIFPSIIVYLVCLVGFYLPVESGEKTSLQTTILLGVIVYLLVIEETLPAISHTIPLIAMYFGATMILVTVAVLMAVFVTNVYCRKDSNQPIPPWLALLLDAKNRCRHAKDTKHTDQCAGTLKKSSKLRRNSFRRNTCRERGVLKMSAEESFRFARTNSVYRDRGSMTNPPSFARVNSKFSPANIYVDDSMQFDASGLNGCQSFVENESKDFCEKCKDTLNANKPSANDGNDWILAAQLLDQIFFWLFLIITLCVMLPVLILMIKQ